ncbi:hypothetical protein Hypma_008433 [Hypsizygus marmoreus]|uniref:Cep57 centrosome microtubule-binding domain-containing protein n=1 Tax=Hypsizygus marmoreus TaxID=39966 RepID=A0A369JXT3_HYPMA|nr:hypothetical protein Hypma_008433 [Hypsizygus marmoreus]
MKKHAIGSVLDISIRGDELEHQRVQLEHNLQHTDLSFRLSSASDDDEYNHNQSLEYPRHNSGPTTFPDFASYELPSRDHFEDTHSQIHPWSYRTVDDEDGINPYAGGETMSTAAHHASALTLSAGLGGGRGGRRDISLSGAEYDPDRPLHDMIAGVDSKLSVFDVEASRSKYPGVGSVTFDPLVVDSTAELDRVLQSGYAPPITSHSHTHPQVQSPLHSSSSSSASDTDSNPTSRPKLSDALRRVSFSPKRPRSAQSNRSESRHHSQAASSPLTRPNHPPQGTSDSYNMPTPKPKRRTNIFPTYPAPTPPQPHVRLQPPTPTSSGSQFSKMARGITREIEQEKHGQQAEGSRPASAPVGDKNPFDMTATSLRQPTPRRASSMRQQTPRGKVYLPDVTGLTSAVESPAKMSSEYYPYRGDDGPRESEARLIATLNNVQSKLQHLEEENSVSRRRVRELELELEVCKRDVARERTRVMEREEVIVQQQRDANTSMKRNKGKARAKDISMSMDYDGLHERYKVAVEDKKSLEALITTLRDHLTRLTSELSSHQELLSQLRELRETDVRALKQKGAEIDRLKEEVERLAGEVEVLRGVVEEGLKERRNARDVPVVLQSDADMAMSQDHDEEDEEQGEEREIEHRSVEGSHSRRQDADDDDEEENDDEEPEPFDPVSNLSSSREGNAGRADRTMRTDHATLGSSNVAETTPHSARFIDSAEFERISAEVEERRSATDRSVSITQSHSSHHSARSPSPAEERRTKHAATVEDASDEDDHGPRPLSPSPLPGNSSQASGRFRHGGLLRSQQQQQENASRHPQTQPQASSSSHPPAPTPGRHQPHPPVDETPFPQIRGTHLERLFFSAPEHDEKTCTVCHRRRGVDETWVPSRFRRRDRKEVEERSQDGDIEDEDDEDEGFAEGSQQQRTGKGRQREHVTFSKDPGPWRQQARHEGLPPQTVVARVIRELEDDFTHYKGIYVELADQYKDMDPVSDVPKRNVLAKHLREVIDILEQKGDQIAALYDLLTFKDKPVADSIVPSSSGKGKTTRTVSNTAVASSTWGRNTAWIRR